MPLVSYNLSVSRCIPHTADCKTDWLWVRFPLGEKKYLLIFLFLLYVYIKISVKQPCALKNNFVGTNFKIICQRELYKS